MKTLCIILGHLDLDFISSILGSLSRIFSVEIGDPLKRFLWLISNESKE